MAYSDETKKQPAPAEMPGGLSCNWGILPLRFSGSWDPAIRGD
jgi:hypothetical protein